MSDKAYQYALLRYMHDPSTQEVLNVGVLLYSRDAKYLSAKLNTKYSRLSNAFQDVDGDYYRKVLSYLEVQIRHQQTRYNNIGPIGGNLPQTIELVSDRILQTDESSLFFSAAGAGLATDLDEELEQLYDYFVGRFEKVPSHQGRDDQDIWRSFVPDLDLRHVTLHLKPVTIKTPTYELTFEHAWKNEKWHPLEPVSFDLLHDSSIKEKANKWIGRIHTLGKSGQIGTMYLLVGKPKNKGLRKAYEDAIQNLKDGTASSELALELVTENEADDFAKELAKIIEAHEK